MQNIYLIPNWFFGLDVVFELAFAVITLIVALNALNVYKISRQYQSRIFGYSFLSISVAYFIQSFMNFSIISKLNENICNILKIQSVNALNAIGMYAHIILFIIGFSSLAYMTLNTKNKKTYFLLIALSLFFVLSSPTKIYSFYFVSSILLAFITLHYLTNYMRNRQTKTLLVFFAFVFLLFGSIHFLFAVNHALFYAIGHFFELAAYLLILINILLVLKNGKEKKQT